MIRIVAIKNLKDFCDNHSQYAEGIKAWITTVESQKWQKPQDIVETFGPKAIDILPKKDKKVATKIPNRVVFDIKGNNIRIIAKYLFHENLKEQILYIKWIGTHAEYDKLCDKNLQYDIDMFG
jgi:mRNA interferase HigB